MFSQSHENDEWFRKKIKSIVIWIKADKLPFSVIKCLAIFTKTGYSFYVTYILCLQCFGPTKH